MKKMWNLRMRNAALRKVAKNHYETNLRNGQHNVSTIGSQHNLNNNTHSNNYDDYDDGDKRGAGTICVFLYCTIDKGFDTR